jgi:hypothetical protein
MNVQSELNFNIDQGRLNRDAGIERAVKHADSEIPNWGIRVYELFKKFLEVRSTPFLIEDFRDWSNGKIDQPPSLRSYGFIAPKAAKEGLIEKLKTVNVKNTTAHRCFASEWIKK